MSDETLLTLAADIVSSHVGHNNVAVDDLPRLISSVYASLAGLGKVPETVAERPEPAVSVRSSVKPDHITCLECGARMKMLKRHLATDHGLTPAEYRTRWALNADYPIVAPNYAARRAELAKENGLGRKPSSAVPADDAAEPDTVPAAKRARKKNVPVTAD